MGPVHPLVGGRLTQGVYHLSDSWTAKGSWKPSILPLPENAGLWLSRNSPPCREMPPADPPFLSVVSRRISFSAPQGLQKRGQIKNLNSFPAPLLGPSRLLGGSERQPCPGAGGDPKLLVRIRGGFCNVAWPGRSARPREGPRGTPRLPGLTGTLAAHCPPPPWMWPRCSGMAGLGWELVWQLLLSS